MKGLKKIALASTIAAVSAGAQAELKALDDAAMGELTGQAGLTIDIETEWSIGEFAYQDAGLVVLKDMSMGGQGNRASKAAGTGPVLLDNIRLHLDVNGSGAVDARDRISNYGMSKVKGLAAIHALQGGNQDFVDAAEGVGNPLAGLVAGNAAGQNPGNLMNGGTGASIDAQTGHAIDNERVNGDGDLTLHFGFNDAWQAAGGFDEFHAGNGTYNGNAVNYGTLTWDVAVEMVSQAVDFEFGIGQIALAESSYGDIQPDGSATRLGAEAIDGGINHDGIDDDNGGAGTTTLISDLVMSGYLGPMDIKIENKGNGFGADNSGVDLDQDGTADAGTGNANSKILWDSFFQVTDLDLYIDIAGVQLSDIQIHNKRGDRSSLNTITTSLDVDPATGAVVGIVQENTTAFGFAHSKREIFAVKDAILDTTRLFAEAGAAAAAGTPGQLDLTNVYVDGIAINTRFKGDIDIGAISFGNTGDSIGSIYMTDVQSTTNWTISAH